MRKTLLAMLMASALVFTVTPAFAADELEEAAPTGDTGWSAYWGDYDSDSDNEALYGAGNQWNQIEGDEEGADYWEWMPSIGNKYSNFTGPSAFGGMDIAGGYAEDGRFHKYLSDKNLGNNTPDIDGDYDVSGNSTLDKAQSRIEFDTDEPLSAPLYSLPCPFEPFRDNNAQNMADNASPNDKGGAPFDNPTFDSSHFDCSYVARDPQTSDIGSAVAGEAEGIVFDDLFQYMEDFTDSNPGVKERHIGQDIDILFYSNNIGTGTQPDGQLYKAGLAIDQTLDQDLADFDVTPGGGPGNGMAQVLWQDFNLAKLGVGAGNVELGDDIEDADAGWIDQFIYSYMSDFDTEATAGPDDPNETGNNNDLNNGQQGVKTSYMSKTVIPGAGGDPCNTVFDNCSVTEELGHGNVNVTANVDSTNNIDKNVHHRTNQEISDP